MAEIQCVDGEWFIVPSGDGLAKGPFPDRSTAESILALDRAVVAEALALAKREEA